MTKQDDKKKTDSAASGAASFLNSAYKAGIGAAHTMHQTAIDIPLTILAQMGLKEEKVTALREKSHELIDELYHAIDSVASKSGLVGDDDKGAAAKSAKDK